MNHDFHDQVLEKRAFFFSVSTCYGLKLASTFSRISPGINKHKTTSQSSFREIDFSKLNKHLVDWKCFLPGILKTFWLLQKISVPSCVSLWMSSYALGCVEHRLGGRQTWIFTSPLPLTACDLGLCLLGKPALKLSKEGKSIENSL